MKSHRGSILALAIVGVMAGMSGVGFAIIPTSNTLNNLDAGVGSIGQGNAIYSNFSYGGVTLDSTVKATASTDGSGNSVITFTRTSGTWTQADGNSVIGFTATFLTPMSQTKLDFVASASGQTISSVGETINDGSPHSLQVFTGFLGTQLTDTYTFGAPISSLTVVSKSIDIAVDQAGSSGTITSVDNVYLPGTGGGVPEPATLSVLGVGAVGLLLRRRSATR